MAEPGDRAGGAAQLLTTLGLLAAIALGSVWVGLAVVQGSPVGVVVRFAVSLAGAWYYLVLHRVARGRLALPGPR
jgi:hypothetical protein